MGNTILVGSQTNPAATLTPDRIQRVEGVFSSSLIGDTLSIDTFSPTVRSGISFGLGTFVPSGSTGMKTADGENFRVRTKTETHPDALLPYGTPLWWYVGDELKGKFYAMDVERVSRDWYTVTAYSAIGLLERVRHIGGMYEGASMETVLAEIIGSVFPYSVSPAVAAQRAYGWLPAQSARENLHWLLTAYGINVTKDANGDPYFEFVSAGTPTTVPQDRTFIGGSVRRGAPVSRVEVTEHQFIALESGELVTVFDNTEGSGYADHRRVTFQDAPVFGLTPSEGLTIHSSNCNFAEVSGIGTITARKYAHITSVIGKDNPAATQERVQSISGDTMISGLNSNNVLARLYGFYTAGYTLNADLKVTTELPNQFLSLHDAFGDERTGWLKSMSFSATTFLRAKAELITGYTPGHYGNNYSHVRMVTEDITDEQLEISGRVRIVLIQGGTGGQGGGQGGFGLGDSKDYGGTMIHTSSTAEEAYSHAPGSQAYTQSPAPGGKPGAAGEGGKIYVRELDVTTDMLWTVHVGTGGQGGAAHVATSFGDVEPGEPGTPGTHTTLTVGGESYSSEAGVQSPSGIKDLISGAIYAATGAAGYKGGDGGLGTETNAWGISGNGGAGESVAGFSGGSGGAGLSHARAGKSPGTAGGGGGGGAAYGADGSSGRDAELVEIRSGSGSTANWSDNYYGGAGGEGANALPPPDAGYGTGGGGGHGGGGAGNSGGARIQNPARSGTEEYAYPGNVNGGIVRGGSGSRGGHGGAGLALIYWG